MARIEYKSPDQIRLMRRAGLVVAQIHHALREQVRPGLTTGDLDEVAAKVLREAGATSNFLGYHGYPANVCISVNDEVVHGIPGQRRLSPGDVVSFDCGAVVEGWHGDAAFTVVLDPADPADVALSDATEDAMWSAIAALATAQRLGAVGLAVEEAIERARAASGVSLGIVEDYVGHGIGSVMHQAPDVPNYVTRDRGPKIKPGLCVAIEPMITRGTIATRTLADDWTVVTTDGSRAAHWEHTVAVTDEGVVVLTAQDGGASELARRGVTISSL